MVKQDVIQMCKLDNKEYADMISRALKTICMGKTLRSKTCNIILGLDEHKPRYFTRCVMGESDSVFLSQSLLYPFNPFFPALIQSYPNDVKEILKDDVECCFSDVLLRLLQGGYDVTIQDNLEDYNRLLSLIEFISYYGYNIRITINKKRIYEERLKAIRDLAIKTIFTKDPIQVNESEFTIASIIDMLKKGAISELIIYDNFLVFNFFKNGDGLMGDMGFNYFGLDNDRAFEKQVNDLRSTISRHKSYISEENFALIMSLIQGCVRDFYGGIDFTLLSEEIPLR